MQNASSKHYCRPESQNSAMHIGHKLKLLMRARGISPAEMAKHCEVSRGAVSNWFSSGRISKDNLARAAARLGVTGDEIVTGALFEVPGGDELELELLDGSRLIITRKGVVRPRSPLPHTSKPVEVEDAVQAVAEVLMRLGDAQRKSAEGALQILVSTPDQWRTVAALLRSLAQPQAPAARASGESSAYPGPAQAATGRRR